MERLPLAKPVLHGFFKTGALPCQSNTHLPVLGRLPHSKSRDVEDAVRHLISTTPPPDLWNGKSSRRLDPWRNRIPDKWLGEDDDSDDADCRPATPVHFPKAVELTVLAKELRVDLQAVAANLPKAAGKALGKRVPSIDNVLMQNRRQCPRPWKYIFKGRVPPDPGQHADSTRNTGSNRPVTGRSQGLENRNS